MIGKVLNGRYEIVEKIGEGGMSCVYRAKCRLLNRDVAIKILKDEFTNDENVVEKFKGEAAAAASLSGNNIVNIYDVGSENRTNYIVMELVEGNTLKEFIKKNADIEESKAVEIAIQIAKALQSAHNKKIIHRDIKPQNIIINNNGGVKVADFGIAKAMNQSTITHTTQVMGTAHYLSPEQAKGGFVDYRSDIYSFGVVLYELVTGKVPHDSDSIVSVAIKHLQEEVIPPSKVKGNISEGFNQLILKCLSKDPQNRYKSAQELLVDLYRLKQNKKVNIVSTEKDDLGKTKVMNSAEIDYEIKKLRENREEKKVRKKSKTKIGVIALAMLLVLAISVGITLLYDNYKNNGSKDTKVVTDTYVPFIVGEELDTIKSELINRNLKFSILREAKSDFPRGTIIEVKPVEGSKVEEGTELLLVISEGPEGVKVSDYRGMNISTVKGMLTSDGLILGTVQENSSIMEPGKIISQSPEAGSEVDKNSKISFVISSGPEIKLIKVPDLTDTTLEDGKEILEDLGLVVSNITDVETSDKEKNNIIFSQSISMGTEVREGTQIDISYYKYKENDEMQVVVPNFVGMYGIDAEQKAFNTGINVEIIGKEFDKVIEQSIAPGEKINVNDKIIIKTKKDEEE